MSSGFLMLCPALDGNLGARCWSTRHRAKLHTFLCRGTAIQTARGMLTLRLTGVFDTVRGEFSELERVTGGTGVFKGARSTLWLIGTTSDGTTFTGDLIGEVCLIRQRESHSQVRGLFDDKAELHARHGKRDAYKQSTQDHFSLGYER